MERNFQDRLFPTPTIKGFKIVDNGRLGRLDGDTGDFVRVR